MSIDRDTFENTSEDELEELSVPEQVLGFLAANDDRAFKAREIASQMAVDEGAVSTALSRLKDRADVDVEILDGRPHRHSRGEVASWRYARQEPGRSWGVQSIGHEDIDFWQGRLADDFVDTATIALVDELR